MVRILYLFCLCALLICAGCGGGASNTNGTLALTVTPNDQTGGRFNVVALATYTPPAGKIATGIDITITTSIHTLNGTPVIQTDKLSADPTGTVNKSYTINQTTGPLYVDVSASTGGLPITKSVTIPSLVSLTTSPTTVAFPATSPAGTSQTVTVSGGTAPYTASMDAAHASDMSIGVNGTAITLNKKNNSGLTPVIGAQLTIADNNGNSVTIPVGYN